jgi:ABC-type lipoprotein export system ATPase subunit
MSRGDIILRLVDVTRVYETQEGRKIVALQDVTTSFKRGEFVAVVGKSGSGKSTLINILGGLDTPTSGDYFLEGNNIARIREGQWDAIRNEKIGFIFQEYHLIEYLSVYKNVEIALKYQQSTTRKSRDAKIKDVLTRVGLIDHMNKLPGQLSGGQRQRVAIARALVKDPAIILADEPTGALDHKTSETVIELIKGLSKERLVIVVTHDRGIANEHATRIIELTEGRFTSDLIREDIPQTYQNVYKKTNPTNLRLRDKFELTFAKLGSQWLRTFFTALSLALAFSFTILFSGVERGITESYDAYFEALNEANSYAFSLRPLDRVVSLADYEQANEDLRTVYDVEFADVDSDWIAGLSPDVAFSQASGGVEQVLVDPTWPDPLTDHKVRLIDIAQIDSYSYDDLFLGDGVYPLDTDELMVTSKFLREYARIDDDVTNLTEYIGTTISLPYYTFTIQDGIHDVAAYLDTLVELEDGSIVEDNPLFTQERVPIRYLRLNLPGYCYQYDALDEYHQRRCITLLRDDQFSRYFETIEDYIAYLDDFRDQVNQIDPLFFDLLYRSGAVYYLIDETDAFLDPGEPRYIERVYQAVYDAANTGTEIVYVEETVFRDQSQWTDLTITAIIENDNESILYFDYQTYDGLFVAEAGVTNVTGYYSINLESGINRDNDPYTVAVTTFAIPLIQFDREDAYADRYEIRRTEPIEQGEECAIYAIDNVLNEGTDFDDVPIAGDVFTIADYSGCKVQSESYQYLNSIRILFGVFFNVLMFISIVFFNLLLSVVLGERIGEIGIYRSVGSTAKDIKYLFFMEVVIIVLIASAMSIGIIYLVNEWINAFFLAAINQGSGVITFAGMKLTVGNDGRLTSIRFFNLFIYIVIVSGLLAILSNRSVTRLANTKPIDILRSKEE